MPHIPFIVSKQADSTGSFFIAKLDTKRLHRLKDKDFDTLSKIMKSYGAEYYYKSFGGFKFKHEPPAAIYEINFDLQETYRKRGRPRKMEKGGLIAGKSHADGGVKAVIKDTGTPIEVEGGEVIINKNTVQSEQTFSFQNKTAKEILSELNQAGGGVPIYESGGEIIMEKGGVLSNPDMPSEYSWDELPDILKVPTNVAKVKIKEISPTDPGIVSIFSLFVTSNELRPYLNGIFFDETNIVGSDSHKLINYPCNTSKKGIFELKTGKEIEGEYPEYWNVIPPFNNSKEVDVITLKTYCEAALNFCNPQSHMVAFVINDYQIGFKASFLINVLTAFLKLGYTKIYASSTNPSSAIIFTPDSKPKGHKFTKKDTLVLLMPLMLDSDVLPKSELKIGAKDSDLEWSLNAYFDFNKNCIISQGKEYRVNPKATANTQANLTIEQTKVIASLSRVKTYRTLPILDYFMVKEGNLIRTNLESTLIINDCGLPDGLYWYRNALLMQYDDKDKNRGKLYNTMDDYPTYPEVNTGIGTAFSEDLKEHLLRAFEFVANDELRPVMNGVLFDFDSIYSKNKDQIALISSDSHQLAVNLMDLTTFSPENKVDFIFPYSKFNELCLRLFNDGAVSVYTDIKETNFGTKRIENVKFVSGNVELITRVVEGEYPKYDSIIPKNYKNSVSFPKSELIKMLTARKAKDADRLMVTFDIKTNNKLRIIVYQKPEDEPYNWRKDDEQLEVNKIGVLEYNLQEAPAYQPIGILLMPLMAERYKLHEEYAVLLKGVFVKNILENLESEEVNFYFEDETRATFFNVPGLEINEPETIELKPEDDIFGELKYSKLIPGLTKNETDILIAFFGSIDGAIKKTQAQLDNTIKPLVEKGTIRPEAEEIFRNFINEKKKEDIDYKATNLSDKELWELTQRDFVDLQGKKSIQRRRNAEVWHKNIIKNALSENKPVPPEVLKDYPELNSNSNNKTKVNFKELISSKKPFRIKFEQYVVGSGKWDQASVVYDQKNFTYVITKSDGEKMNMGAKNVLERLEDGSYQLIEESIDTGQKPLSEKKLLENIQEITRNSTNNTWDKDVEKAQNLIAKSESIADLNEVAEYYNNKYKTTKDNGFQSLYFHIVNDAKDRINVLSKEPDDYTLEDIGNKVFDQEELTEHEKHIWDNYQNAPTGFKYDYKGNLVNTSHELQSIIDGFNTLADIADTTTEKQELQDIIAGFEALKEIEV